MKLLILLLPVLVLCLGLTPDTYREKQMKYTRVREAYAAKEKIVDKTLTAHTISRDSLRIYLRAFKTEKIIELWAKNISDSVFSLIREFTICDLSGDVGAKRRSRDLQVPEGFLPHCRTESLQQVLFVDEGQLSECL